MRILHSSDWHLGQHFMGKSRDAEHRAFLDWLLAQIKQHRVDALVVAGDLFDTGTPPSYARTLYNNFIVEMRAHKCQLVVLGGNHDSVATLHESRDLLACLGTSVIGGISDNPADQVLLLKDRKQQPGALLCAIPFLRSRELLQSQAGQSSQARQQALLQAMQQHYQALYDEAVRQRDKLDLPNLPIMATGHLTTVGGKSSESVRDIYIGSLDAFPVSAFPPVDYLALGHLHRPQQVADNVHIRYSGSPIPLSFDEASMEKEVVLVEFGKKGSTPQITPITVPRSQELVLLKGTLGELEDKLARLLKEGALPDETPPIQLGFEFIESLKTDESGSEEALTDKDKPLIWLEVEVAGDDYLNDLQSRVEAIVADKPVELLRVRRKRKAQTNVLEREVQETLTELSVDDVFARRLAEEAELPDEISGSLTQAFNEILNELAEHDTAATTAEEATA